MKVLDNPFAIGVMCSEIRSQIREKAMRDYQDIVQQLLSQAGVKINGSSPWDIQVHNPKFYKRVITQGALGLGESYMDGCWSCEAVDQLFYIRHMPLGDTA